MVPQFTFHLPPHPPRLYLPALDEIDFDFWVMNKAFSYMGDVAEWLKAAAC